VKAALRVLREPLTAPLDFTVRLIALAALAAWPPVGAAGSAVEL